MKKYLIFLLVICLSLLMVYAIKYIDKGNNNFIEREATVTEIQLEEVPPADELTYYGKSEKKYINPITLQKYQTPFVYLVKIHFIDSSLEKTNIEYTLSWDKALSEEDLPEIFDELFMESYGENYNRETISYELNKIEVDSTWMFDIKRFLGLT